MRGVTLPPSLSGLSPLARLARTGTSISSHAASRAFNACAVRSATPIADPTAFGSQLIEPGVILKGYSGRQYTVENILQDRQDRQVYLAKADEKMFVLKSLLKTEYNYALPLQLGLGKSPYLRALRDTVPDQKMFVNEYMTDHLLNLAFKDLSLPAQKRILRDALRGLAALHSQNIAHLDVKANNIMVDYRDTSDGIEVDRVQLSDLEDSTHIPPGQSLNGMQVGNHFWRSPEAHVQGAIGTPSDIFSLAIVAIFLHLRSVIFWVDNATKFDPTMDILERQISFFAEWKDFDGFLEYLGPRHPWVRDFRRMAATFSAENPRRPFSVWKSNLLHPDLKDLIVKMTNFDPRKRITASEALEHPWFDDVEDDA
ncbi:protein kinase-like domain-containing protein [Xylariomycetidae sp. FL0641]|nr:protein kinase-like domain-containing protein [Xylariomycetidae sp. FL0641]